MDVVKSAGWGQRWKYVILTDDREVSIHLERVSMEYSGEGSENIDTVDVKRMHMRSARKEAWEKREQS